MNKKKIITILTGGALALATVFGVVTYRVVNAQASTPTPNAPNGAGQPGADRGMRGGGISDENLATALGISVDQLQAAQTTATDEALKQAVADGSITQDQADQFAQNNANGGSFGGMPFLRDSAIDYNALLAQALGISTDELQAANQKAYFANLDQAVQDGTMTQEQADAAKGNYALSNDASFQSTMKSAYQAAVQQAVTDGVITQAQADQFLSNNNGAAWGGLGGPAGFGGQGGPGGHGGFGPQGGQAPQGGSNSATPPDAPSTTPSSGSGS